MEMACRNFRFFRTLDPQLHWKPVHLSLSGGYFGLVFRAPVKICSGALKSIECEVQRNTLQQHPSSLLLRQAETAQKFAEAMVGAQRFEPGLNRQSTNPVIAFVASFAQPPECLVIVTESDMEQSNIECRYERSARRQLLKLLKDFCGVGLLTGHS